MALFGNEKGRGLYTGTIAATGWEIGTSSNYVGGFVGTETTTLDPDPAFIQIQEVSVGVELLVGGGSGGTGRYQLHDESGWFVFVQFNALGDHGSFGAGTPTGPGCNLLGPCR